ncbi:hypothetical protein [Mesorhizobium sp.]|uniref:hypothetical protein n=1 Tax=Mesorhizobium sp. TaxID=1871066 RepID=UPI00257C629C|nr:hypothetical protein [Mesorhizobium sp.]
MEIHEIRYFRVASLLRDQPALTRAIQKLEAELGGIPSTVSIAMSISPSLRVSCSHIAQMRSD